MIDRDARPEADYEVRVRPVEACHISDLIHLGESVNLSPWSAQSYLAELKNPDSVMLRLVSVKNKTMGFVVGRIVKTGDDERDAEIYNIAVKIREQRRGLGQLLLDAFCGHCRLSGVTNIWLEVRQSNEAAIAFYKKNGFAPVQKRSHFYTNPREHGWLMRLKFKTNDA
jgi:ribosomal-protein-alanine N-acetyltransferase